MNNFTMWTRFKIEKQDKHKLAGHYYVGSFCPCNAWAVSLNAAPKTGIGIATHYALSQRKYLERYLSDGRLEKGSHDGMKPRRVVWDGLDAYEIKTNTWRTVVIAGCGPRIAFLGKINGENILYWQNDMVSRGLWRLRGGHRVWGTRPMADESEDIYLPDNDPCSVMLVENGMVVTAPKHPANQLSRGMEIECLSDCRFCVTNFVRNDGDLIYSGGVWSPTCINPEGKHLEFLWDRTTSHGISSR